MTLYKLYVLSLFSLITVLNVTGTKAKDYGKICEELAQFTPNLCADKDVAKKCQTICSKAEQQGIYTSRCPSAAAFYQKCCSENFRKIHRRTNMLQAKFFTTYVFLRILRKVSMREKCPYLEFFWSVFNPNAAPNTGFFHAVLN